MSTYKPNLDGASARKISRGQISLVVDNTAERIANLSAKFPSKRGAWLRAVENEFKEAYKEMLLAVVSEKRRVFAIYFLPLAEQYDGWLAIEVNIATFGTATKVFTIAAISESAIISLMRRLRDCRPFDALKDETLEWFIPSVLTCVTMPDRPDILCIPTKSGYFRAKWDHSHNTYVYTNWQPDRLLTDKDQTVLSRLRSKERLGMAAELGNCI
jgi:hypothetical protein